MPLNYENPIPKIIIADDDADDHFFLSKALSDTGLSASTDSVYSGVQLLKLLRDGAEADLIFLDLNMPILDGYGVLNEMRNLGLLEKINVYVLSTSKNEVDKIKSIAYGASGYFTKPAVYAELQEIASKVCRQWQQNRNHLFSGA